MTIHPSCRSHRVVGGRLRTAAPQRWSPPRHGLSTGPAATASAVSGTSRGCASAASRAEQADRVRRDRGREPDEEDTADGVRDLRGSSDCLDPEGAGKIERSTSLRCQEGCRTEQPPRRPCVRHLTGDSFVWRSEVLTGANAEGRRECLEQFARSHVDRSYRLAALLLGDASEAEDATHDAVVRAWERWAGLRDETRFDAWFQRILVNECRNRLRRHRRSPIRAIDVGEPAAPSARLEALGERDALRAALATLTPDHRVALVLRFYLDLSVDEISQCTGTRAGTVKSRLHHGLRALSAAYSANDRIAGARS